MIAALTSGVRRCQFATTSRSAALGRHRATTGALDRRRYHAAKWCAELKTRVQFPPPPLFLNMRLQATDRDITRLKPLIAMELCRTRKRPLSDKNRQPAAARVPRALPKALPGHYSMTLRWPLSWPLGQTCPTQSELRSWRWPPAAMT